jgi:uncharacterized membrane protein
MLTYEPFKNLSKDRLGLMPKYSNVNVGEIERYGSILGGAALVAAGLARKSIPGALLALIGGALVFRGASGRCELYAAMGLNTANPERQRPGVPDNFGTKVEKTIVINRSPEELYRFWRNLENLPRFMNHVESVRVLDDKRSHWRVKAPAGADVEWDAEIINEHENELIAWQSLPGATVQNAGSVRFENAPGNGGTLVKVALEFQPPGGALGAQVAKLFGESPEQQIDDDLHRLKTILETGESPTASSQPQGQ